MTTKKPSEGRDALLSDETPGAGPSKQKLDTTSDVSKPSTKRPKRAREEKQTSQFHQEPGRKIRKLVPPRPFPTVPTSVSATGPRSAHTEGKNRICVTRKTDLGMYLRRCKDVVLKDGHKTLYLHAMGAAIPHLARLAVSLPSILPYAASDIQTEVFTGTVELQDEVIPEDEDEDISLRTRGKSTMSITIKIEGGDKEDAGQAEKTSKKQKNKGRKDNTPGGGQQSSGSNRAQPEQLVFTEEDLNDDILQD